jgi:hypothetical protein
MICFFLIRIGKREVVPFPFPFPLLHSSLFLLHLKTAFIGSLPIDPTSERQEGAKRFGQLSLTRLVRFKKTKDIQQAGFPDGHPL